MLTYFRKFFDYLLGSFVNDEKGFSGRKLSAFAGVIISIVITYQYTHEENLSTILLIWLLFSLLCLSIVTMEQVIRLKEGRKIAESQAHRAAEVTKAELKAEVAINANEQNNERG